MRIFITGGAGYIGSHAAHLLENAGHKTIVYDNLSSGKMQSLPSGSIFINGDVKDKLKLNNAISSEKPDAVVHFAALIEVEESVRQPIKYYENNFYGTLCLLEACENNKINKIIFSSTAAVYGDAQSDLITEGHSINPINPYGVSKVMSEKAIQDFAQANNLFRYVILRYFNVAGAQADQTTGNATLKIGQFRERATHLITLAARAAAGTIPSVQIFGTDYPTKDGTCLRDYIHVDDLAMVHLKALEYLEAGNNSDIFNCGYGAGYSVQQVIQAMKLISGVDFDVSIGRRRPGDSSALVANSNKAKEKLSWQPKFNNLNLICKSAFDWEVFRKNMNK